MIDLSLLSITNGYYVKSFGRSSTLTRCCMFCIIELSVMILCSYYTMIIFFYFFFFFLSLNCKTNLCTVTWLSLNQVRPLCQFLAGGLQCPCIYRIELYSYASEITRKEIQDAVDGAELN